VFIPVPCAGSPAPLKQGRPPAYPSTQREPWRPRTKPPTKGEASLRLMREIAANEQAVRSMLRPRLPPTVTR
jgi:hypothetical protein